MNLKEIIDNVLNEEEEGGEILRFNEIKFYISGRTEGKRHISILRMQIGLEL